MADSEKNADTEEIFREEARREKQFARIVGAIVLAPVGLFVIWLLLFMLSAAHPIPSEIVDFRPTSFQAKANSRFFYSVGNELKYSDQIDPEAPTLLHGKINSFLVAPDGKTIAVVVNGQLPDSNGVSVIVNEQLMVVDGETRLIREVTPVDSIYRGFDSVHLGPKPIGQQFFRDDNFQWSKDSTSLYLIKDEFYKSLGSQLYSEKAELWKYEVKTGDLQLILKPFPAYTYFFGLKSGVYFLAAENGKLQLRCFDGQHVTDIGEPDSTEISVRQLAAKFVEKPFYSFPMYDYDVLLAKQVHYVDQEESHGELAPDRRGKLIIGEKSYLAFTLGEGMKGGYYGYDYDRFRNAFLPGDRYFLVNVNCGNYTGQLLIDAVTGNYTPLPKDSRVYITLNTASYPHYRITSSGIEPASLNESQ